MLLRFCRPVPQPHLCPREPDAVRERSVEVELGLRRRRWTQRSPIDCDDLSDVEPPLDMLVMVTKLRLGDRAIIGARAPSWRHQASAHASAPLCASTVEVAEEVSALAQIDHE
jgi:hypothetical protein